MLYVVNSWGSFVVVDYFFLRKVMVECVYFPAQKILFPADVALHTCLIRREKWLSTPLFRLSSWVRLQYYYSMYFSLMEGSIIISMYIYATYDHKPKMILCLRRMHKINKLGHNWKSLPATWPINGWRFKNFISFLLRFLFLKK